MAQVGYTPIQLYYSNTTTNAPAALANGELAINQADGKLFYRNSAGVVTQFSLTSVTTISFGSTGLTPSTATSGVVSVAGTLAAGYGGTSFSTYATGDLIYASAANTLAKLAAGTNGHVLTLAAGVPTWSAGGAGGVTTISFGSTGLTPSTATSGAVSVAGTLALGNGGTGFSTYAAGDLIYASAVNTLAKLTAGTNGYVLTLAAGVPTWAASTGGVTSFSAGSTGLTPNTATTGAISLAGTLDSAYGGTGFTAYATGDLIYASATNTLAKLAAGTNGYVLTLAAGVPTWAAGGAGGVTTISFGSTGLTPNVATSGAVSVAGTLAAGFGGTGLSAFAIGDTMYASATTPTISKLAIGTAGQVMIVNTGGTAPEWTSQSNLTAGKATNIAGGVAGTMFYNTAADTTTNLAIGSAYNILGVNTGGTSPSWQTLSSLIDNALSASAQGTLIYRDASTWAALAPGASGTFLKANGAAANPSWATVSITGFTSAQNTTAPNATNNVSSLTVSAVSTNAFAAIVPKGTGGLIGAIPDSTATGGDIRGTYSVDLQFTRSASTMVASGTDASLIGGSSNTASSTDSSVVGGNNNNAGAAQSGIFAGANNKTTGAYSAVIGGDFGDDRGLSGALVQGAPGAATLGQYQSRRTQLAAATTDATATRMTTDITAASGTNQLNLAANTAFAFAGIVVAGVTTAGNAKAWNFRGLIKRGAGVGTTAIVGTVAVNIDAADAGASTWAIAVTADTTNGTLAVTATGQAATSIKWTCVITSSEVVTT